MKFNVTELTKFGNGGVGKVVLIPTNENFESSEGVKKVSGSLELTLEKDEDLEFFKEMGKFDVIIRRAQ